MTPERLSKVQKSSGNKNIEESLFNKRVKDAGGRPATSDNQIGSMRSERLFFDDKESMESCESIVHPSTAPEAGRSVDVVVVDVHDENKGSENNLVAGKLFKRRNNATENAKRPEIDSLAKDNDLRKRDSKFERANAWEIQESIDCIKEYEDSGKVFDFDDENEQKSLSKIERIGDSPETRSLRRNQKDSKSGESSSPQLFGSLEKIVFNSKEDSAPEGEPSDPRLIEEPKRRRKRWTKNQNNLNLTQELIANSSDANQSGENEARLSTRQGIKPIPAPRRKKGTSKSLSRESILAFDNAAFRSDTEEVLRIETEVYEPQGSSDGTRNFGQNTKIEMTNLYESRERDFLRENCSEDEFEASSTHRDYRRSNKIETLDASDTSHKGETQIHRISKSGEYSDVIFSPSKSREQTSARTSESSGESDDQVPSSNAKSEKRDKKDKKWRRDRVSNKKESASFDTSNSLTDISDIPRGKSRRKLSRKSESRKLRDSANSKRVKKRGTEDESENDLIERSEDREEKFISVTIHKADVLKTDFTTRHPMVKVHMVDIKTGNYLRKLDSDGYGSCGYLQPLMTGKFDFKENKSIVPNWEEELIFEYSFNEVVRPGDNTVLILFEILDLLNFAEASFNYNLLGNEGCWHKIAWAFLRPVGVNETIHTNKKLRLQLYEPLKIYKKCGRLSECEVFKWWRSTTTTREKYPSTLYVTLKCVDPPIQEPILYDNLSFNDLKEMESESVTSCRKSSELLQLPRWSRLAAQSCKIPNNRLFETDTFENGSFRITFSNSGKYLACVGSDDGKYPIFVYAIPDGKMVTQFIGHSNFVYSLNWSSDDKYLLSVSSDQTACVWDVANKIIQNIQMLPHPSYVYSGQFYPVTKSVLITGCFDRIARVWTKSESSKRYELTQELSEHRGYVNSLCFKKDGALVTADSIGVIILWNMKKRGGGVFPKREWRLLRIIKNKEIENVIVNTIILHPLGSRLLVHSRDDGLRMIDLGTGVVLQRYKGLRNRSLQINACLSPCGGLVLCGGEDSSLTVWNLESGKRLAKYSIREAKVVACVDYHPLDHILAVSTFGSISSVQIMNFEKDSSGENVGLNLMGDDEAMEDSDGVEITMNFDKNYTPRNLNGNYSRRTIASVSKRGERFDPGMDRRSKTPGEMSGDKNKENYSACGKRELWKLKIQRLNDSEDGLKSKSAARFNNIIEKIDKILINTSMNKRDLELSTCSSNDMRRDNLAKVSSKPRRDPHSHSKRRDRVESRSWKSGNRDRSSTSNTDATIEAYNEGEEFIEMQNMKSPRNGTSENGGSTRLDGTISRSKCSRAGYKSNISSRREVESEEEGSLSKSSSVSHRKESSREKRLEGISDFDVESNGGKKTRTKRRVREKRLSSFSDDKPGIPGTESCLIDLETMKTGSQSNPSASDSAGTYTMDKEKFSNSGHSDRSKVSDTSSSVKSNATFIIENEKSSATRPTKKKQ